MLNIPKLYWLTVGPLAILVLTWSEISSPNTTDALLIILEYKPAACPPEIFILTLVATPLTLIVNVVKLVATAAPLVLI